MSIASPSLTAASDARPRTPLVSAELFGPLLVLSITSIFIGLIWDISWHMTIGRDTFWTPAHMAIYLGGAIPGIACGMLAIKTTFFGSAEERARSVVLWGGRAPFGAWVVIWGALAMITAGPFDDWWHAAYGLDVKIISPPHVLLFFGVFMVIVGTLLYLLRELNRNALQPHIAHHLFSYAAGVFIGLVAFLFLPESWPNRQHSEAFYILSAWTYPGMLTVAARASRLRWGATLAAASYMLLVAAMIWILPLFHAEPKLGPIRHPVDHMVPPYFPLWLIVPALWIDLVHRRSPAARSRFYWPRIVALIAIGFTLLFLAVQWHFSEFLLSPAADNAFFAGGRSVPYYTAIAQRHFIFWDPAPVFTPEHLLPIFGAAAVSTVGGLLISQWMQRVVR